MSLGSLCFSASLPHYLFLRKQNKTSRHLLSVPTLLPGNGIKEQCFTDGNREKAWGGSADGELQWLMTAFLILLWDLTNSDGLYLWLDNVYNGESEFIFTRLLGHYSGRTINEIIFLHQGGDTGCSVPCLPVGFACFPEIKREHNWLELVVHIFSVEIFYDVGGLAKFSS